jgi:hypothetical protein
VVRYELENHVFYGRCLAEEAPSKRYHWSVPPVMDQMEEDLRQEESKREEEWY